MYYKNRLFLFTELSYIKKWIDEMLNKGFIYKLTFLITVPLLLAVKFNGGI